MTAPSCQKTASKEKEQGLADVVACNSAICFIDGQEGRLIYRGYDALDLARNSSFEEVAYLLWYGRLPGLTEFQAFLDGFTGGMQLPVETTMILRMFPNAATSMEVLRTAVSSLGHWDPDSGNTRLDASLRKAQRLTERIPLIIAAHQRLKNGQEPITPIPNHGIAYNFLYTLQGQEPDPDIVHALDVALILHADHELNASTFAARVTAATMSDIYSAVTSAIGALKGPLHGGANADVMDMFEAIGAPEKAESWILDRLAVKGKIPGFGHRVYKCEDPRVGIMREYAEQITRKAGDTRFYEIAQVVEKTMLANSKVFPNVDFYTGTLYRAMGIPTDLFTPIFAMSRAVGWTAHILEQWRNNRLIRPSAKYVGPSLQHYIPIETRTP
ncbi:MAG: citrate synthase [Proteobacteria bacterium]|jgi:citrate synthase|nr:citrate synthase [Desulfocapsa sp.]MBU3944485.1 citrate synthase [Pseudomonadota bacterium]MCG2744189.1 citrate synthase [Desulfobacteraceae bacterium]MBU3983889.1 citrate synthase [Pseudomonadota bacterium]MBU4029716.1 citrate synthase [Pseudomonadota bacterium]